VHDQPRVRAYPLALCLILTLVAGAFGLPVGWFAFPSIPASLVGLGWKIGTIAVMLVAIRFIEFRRPTLEDTGIVPVRGRVHRDRAAIAIVGSVAMVALTAMWDSIPGLRELASSGSGSSYDAGTVTLGVLFFELLVRYPMQVVAEESFFRGFLQPRIAFAAPVVTGVLFAVYHLQQWETIPSLVPFGIALCLLRWWLGSIWPGVVLHYLGNAVFMVSLYGDQT
jgi:membrane protease YdiL (CAAX protease family)